VGYKKINPKLHTTKQARRTAKTLLSKAFGSLINTTIIK